VPIEQRSQLEIARIGSHFGMGFLRKRSGDLIPAATVSDGVRAAFDRVTSTVAAAQRALLAAIPTSRDPGIPLAQALAEFGKLLREAADAMPGWRGDHTVHEWTKCSDALARAQKEAASLRLEPGTLGFERLNARVGDVLHPLETFAEVERAMRKR
jgi:hypothetical protein